jgi:hypothetical protein
MISFRRSHITVQPEDCLSEQSEQAEHSGYTTESMESSVIAALAQGHGHLTADHALWLHEHHINWQINVER